MENQVKVFESAEFGSVRTVDIEGVPYFVGRDVATILAYTNPQKAIRDHVDDEDKTVNNSFTVNGTQGILINESGVYALIFGSKLPTAKKFKRWVTNEVLPSIRKNGGYALNDDIRGLKRQCRVLENRIKLLEKDHPMKYTKTLDSAERFISEWVIIPIQYKGLRVEKNALYGYYVEWCYNNGFIPYSKSKFTSTLKEQFNTEYITLKDLTIKENGTTYYKLAITKKS